MQPSMIDVFRAVVRSVPDRESIVHRSTRRNYAELGDRVDRLASLLVAQGLGAHAERPDLGPSESGQDHLALYLHNGPEYLEGLLGALAARVAPVNVNYRYTAAELAYLLGDARPAVVFYHAAFAPVLAEALGELPFTPALLLQVEDGSGTPLLPGAFDYEQALADAPTELTLSQGSADDLMFMYTGGTTGKPKGTLWRNGDMLDNLVGVIYPPGTEAEQAATAVLAAPQLRTLGSAPFMHATGTWGALRALLNGGLVAIPDSAHRLDPAELCDLVTRERLDYISLVGEAFCRPVADELDSGGYDVTCVRIVLLGGVATQAQTKKRLLAHMPHAVMSESVGSSETMAVLRQDVAADGSAEAGVFALLPRACVVDPSASRILSPGEEGDGLMAAREPLPLGYLGDAAKTAETFPTLGGVRLAVPGDLVRLRPDGRVQLLGRTATTVNSGGEKIHVDEVERALLSHASVRDALVLGRPSERWGQEVVAVLQLTDEADDEELRAHAARELARYKLPKAFFRVDAIRRNPMGKPDYGWARALVTADAAGGAEAAEAAPENEGSTQS